MYIDCAVYPTIFTINIKGISRHKRLYVYSLRNFGTHFDQYILSISNQARVWLMIWLYD